MAAICAKFLEWILADLLARLVRDCFVVVVAVVGVAVVAVVIVAVIVIVVVVVVVAVSINGNTF